MVNENDGQSLRDYGNRKKRIKRRRRAVIIAALLILSITGVISLLRIYNRNYQNIGVLKTKDISGSNAEGYLSYGSGVVKYSKDGAVAIDKDGSLLWNGSYELNDPIADTCGKYVVISGRDSKEVHIFNQSGEAGNFTTDYQILKVQVAKQGVVAVLMEDGELNHIILYDKEGTILKERITNIHDQGYPMDIALSDDGLKLALSYLSYSGGKLIDKVSFYNFGDVGDNYTDGFVGGFPFDEGIVIPRIEFINNDTVCAFKDDGMVVFSIKELPDDLFEQNAEGKIQSILYNSKYTGYVLQADGTTSKRIVLYNLEGKKVLDKAIDFEYEKIYLSDEEIILYDNLSCVIMKLNGKVKFRYTFDNNIDAIYPINNLDRYFIAGENKLTEIQLEE